MSREPESRPRRPDRRPRARAAPSEGEEVVYGRNPVRELLRAARRPVRVVYALPALASEPWLAGVAVEPRERNALARLAGTGDHQGVVALTDPYPYAPLADVMAGKGPVICLDGAQDPRNLGAIARVAEAAGAAGLVIALRGSPGVTAVVAKASAGAVEHLPIARAELLAAIHDAPGAGRVAIGADAEEGEHYGRIAWPERPMLVLGAEGAGMRPRVRAACAARVAVPMSGRLGTLNIAVAAGILVFAMKEGLRITPS